MILLESPAHVFFLSESALASSVALFASACATGTATEDSFDLADPALLQLLVEQVVTDPTFYMLSIGATLSSTLLAVSSHTHSKYFVTLQETSSTPRSFALNYISCFSVSSTSNSLSRA